MKMVKKGYRMSNHTVYSHKELLIQYNDHAASMNDKAIQIPKEIIWIEWVSLD